MSLLTTCFFTASTGTPSSILELLLDSVTPSVCVRLQLQTFHSLLLALVVVDFCLVGRRENLGEGKGLKGES